MGLFGALGLSPDADAVLVAAGSDYHGDFGHRGFSHSLLFAATIAGVAFFIARRWGSKPVFTSLLAFLAVASHGLMDAMTYRTRGIPFLWPLSDERFTLPWRPIPPAPFGGHFLSQRGLDVMGIEMIYFLPLTIAALAPSLPMLRRWLAPMFARMFTTVSATVSAAVSTTAATVVSAPVRTAALRVSTIVVVFTLSLAFAQLVLRDSAAVAWLESAHDQTIAVSLQQRPQFQHLR